MKHISHILIIALLVCCATACNSDKRQIRKAAQGYLEAMGNYDTDAAMPYATKDTREKTLPFMKNNIIPLADKAYIESNTPAKIKIDEIIMDTDTAYVAYTKTTPIKELKSEVYLIREEGSWLVDVPLQIPDQLSFLENLNVQDSIDRMKSQEQ